MSGRFKSLIFGAAVAVLLAVAFNLSAAPVEKIAGDVRCVVCGMFVAKYDNWVVQARLDDDTVLLFDGVKDMLAYYFNSQEYGTKTQQDIREIWVKDYYTLEWIDGRQALYVIGSDVYGPMGKEFIPFSSREGAENFLQDHNGKEVLAFDAINDELVQSLRSGTKMRHSGK